MHLQSSSPSYLLMASLDGARAHAQQEGVWEQPLAASHAIRNALLQLPGLKLLSAEDPGKLLMLFTFTAMDLGPACTGGYLFKQGRGC